MSTFFLFVLFILFGLAGRWVLLTIFDLITGYEKQEKTTIINHHYHDNRSINITESQYTDLYSSEPKSHHSPLENLEHLP